MCADLLESKSSTCVTLSRLSHTLSICVDIPHMPTLSHLAGAAQGGIVCVCPFLHLLCHRSLRVHTFHTTAELWRVGVGVTGWDPGGWQEIADEAGCTLGSRGRLGFGCLLCHHRHHPKCGRCWGAGPSLCLHQGKAVNDNL